MYHDDDESPQSGERFVGVENMTPSRVRRLSEVVAYRSQRSTATLRRMMIAAAAGSGTSVSMAIALPK